MSISIALLLLILGFVILIVASNYLVDYAIGISNYFKVSPVIIGLTVVAMGTSLPELMVNISSSLKGVSDIGVGNVLGSNIANIALVLGVTSLICSIALPFAVFRFELGATFLFALLFGVLGWDGLISRFDGALLVLLGVGFNFLLIKNANAKPSEEENIPSVAKKEMILYVLWLLLTIAGTIAGAQLIVESATVIATYMGLSERIIGLTVVAIGTSLPELGASVSAALKNKHDIAVGNVVGSNVMNISFVLGLTACLLPIPVSPTVLQIDFPAVMLFTIAFIALALFFSKISRIAGGIMLAAYLAYCLILAL